MSHFSLHPFFSSCSACALSPQCSGRLGSGGQLGKSNLLGPIRQTWVTQPSMNQNNHLTVRPISWTHQPRHLLHKLSYLFVETRFPHMCLSIVRTPRPLIRLGGRKNADIETLVVFVGVALLLSHGLDLSHPPTHLHTTTFNLGLPKNPTQVSHCKVCA